jgi:hypothetical protein
MIVSYDIFRRWKLEFKFPVMELVDRYAIAQVKHNRTGGANQEELDFYEQQMLNIDKTAIWQELQAFKILHDKIWSLEDDFKKCRIDGTDLAEVGRRALEIRDYNNFRVQLKNTVAEKLNDPVREIKTNV